MAALAKNDAQRIAEHQARVELYAQRADMGLAIFTGLPLGAEAFEGIEEEDSSGIGQMLADSMNIPIEDLDGIPLENIQNGTYNSPMPLIEI
jgi:hypothetical protein